MLKSIIYFCLVLLIAANAAQLEFNDNIRHLLANIKASDLPESVRLSLMNNQGRGSSDASHWCCINEQPITTVTATKIEHGTQIIVTKTKVGYVDCGFMGLMKCSHFVSATRVGMYTYVQTFQVPNMAACHSSEMKCCSGFMLVASNCHSIHELVANQELIQFLSGLGLIG